MVNLFNYDENELKIKIIIIHKFYFISFLQSTLIDVKNGNPSNFYYYYNI